MSEGYIGLSPGVSELLLSILFQFEFFATIFLLSLPLNFIENSSKLVELFGMIFIELNIGSGLQGFVAPVGG